MTHASLFSGIGGFDLAAEIVGFDNKFTCEKDDFCNKILKYYWPKIEHYGDIKTIDFRIWRGQIDIITGGFPCQPFSLAGKRKGTEDDRHLWPEMLRAISEIQPSFVIGENVSGIVNWDGGLVFDQVQSDLETQGYEIIPIILPACAVNAPHRRDRVWFIAANRKYIRLRAIENSNSYGRNYNKWKERSKEWRFWNISTGNNEWLRTHNEKVRIASNCSNSGYQTMYKWKIVSNKKFFTTNTISKRLGGSMQRNPIMFTKSFKKRVASNSNGITINISGFCPIKVSQSKKARLFQNTITNSNYFRQSRKKYRKNESGFFTETSVLTNWDNFPTQSPICSRNDGIPFRLDFITFPKWRNESIKAFGNAIVPKVAVVLLKIIIKIKKEITGNFPK